MNADTVGTVYMFLLCSETSQGIARTYIQTLQEKFVLRSYTKSKYSRSFNCMSCAKMNAGTSEGRVSHTMEHV